MLDEYLVARDYSIISRKGGNSIVLFPEVPYWIATTKQGKDFLKNLDGKKSVLEISNKVLGPGNESIALEFLEPLIESDAVKRIGEEITIDDNISHRIIKPDKVTLTLIKYWTCKRKFRGPLN